MRRRVPAWFTDQKVRDRIQSWWPWGLGIFCAALYGMNPAPMEEVRVAALANFRKPFLRASEWMEVHDVDPETLALELPPQMLFGPLPLEQQMRFVMHALRTDNDLADDYVTRMVIDAMDMSLDPPRNDLLVRAGGQELMQFAVDDFLDRRPNRKRKFFGPDQFLRLLNMCAPHYELANIFIDQCGGVDVIFRALRDAESEYARVLATRALTLLALLQRRDGTVEHQIVSGGFLPQLVDTYRLSTGDPTDTRFSTMLLSSVIRSFATSRSGSNVDGKGVEAVYNTLVAENLVSAVVSNLNLTRYKGVPQHLRLLHDLDEARSSMGFVGPASVGADNVRDFGGVQRPALPPPRTKFQAYFAKEEDNNFVRDQLDQAHKQRQLMMAASTGEPLPASANVGAGSGGGSADDDDDGATSTSNDGSAIAGPSLVRMLPPKDLHAPLENLAYDAEFLPVALGVLDVFPEYFEAATETLKWLERLLARNVATPFEVLEYRGASVLAKLVARLDKEPQFLSPGGPGELCYTLVRLIVSDPECAPFTRSKDPLGSLEMRTALRNLREFAARVDLERVAKEPVSPPRSMGLTTAPPSTASPAAAAA